MEWLFILLLLLFELPYGIHVWARADRLSLANFSNILRPIRQWCNRSSDRVYSIRYRPAACMVYRNSFSYIPEYLMMSEY